MNICSILLTGDSGASVDVVVSLVIALVWPLIEGLEFAVIEEVKWVILLISSKYK